MNVKKIALMAGEVLPEVCWECDACQGISPDYLYCMGKHIDIDAHSTRPDWCPLEAEEVCEWKLVVTKYPYESVTEWDEDMVCQSCRFIVPCTVLEDHLGGIEECKYCPSCGKRIKYVESEE